VDFKADTRTVVNSATITVGITSWPLQSSRVALLQSGVSIAQIGFEGTQGDAANEILAAMQKTPGEVVVSATRAFTLGDEFPTEHNLQVTIKTRSTQIADNGVNIAAKALDRYLLDSKPVAKLFGDRRDQFSRNVAALELTIQRGILKVVNHVHKIL
jgi:hypothetical protein